MSCMFHLAQFLHDFRTNHTNYSKAHFLGYGLLSGKISTATQLVDTGTIEKLKELINQGVNLDAYPEPFPTKTALHQAAKQGKIEKMQLLLDSGANADALTQLDARNSSGLTPLMRAIMKGQIAAMKILLNHGVDLTIKDSAGETALHYAAMYDEYVLCTQDRQMTALLLQHGANKEVRNNDRKTPAQLATDPNIIKLFNN